MTAPLVSSGSAHLTLREQLEVTWRDTLVGGWGTSGVGGREGGREGGRVGGRERGVESLLQEVLESECRTVHPLSAAVGVMILPFGLPFAVAILLSLLPF